MNKTELIRTVAEQAGVSNKEALTVVNTLLNVIGEELKKGEAVSITGFGTFDTKKVEGREGTFRGFKYHTDDQRSPVFTEGKTLKEQVR